MSHNTSAVKRYKHSSCQSRWRRRKPAAATLCSDQSRTLVLRASAGCSPLRTDPPRRHTGVSRLHSSQNRPSQASSRCLLASRFLSAGQRTPVRSGRVGSGRVGSGQVRSGRVGSGRVKSAQTAHETPPSSISSHTGHKSTRPTLAERANAAPSPRTCSEIGENFHIFFNKTISKQLLLKKVCFQALMKAHAKENRYRYRYRCLFSAPIT